MKELSRWPLLLSSVLLIAAAIGIDLTTEGGRIVSYGLVVLGSICLGAFVYAEGARHREWWASFDRKEEEPDE